MNSPYAIYSPKPKGSPWVLNDTHMLQAKCWAQHKSPLLNEKVLLTKPTSYGLHHLQQSRMTHTLMNHFGSWKITHLVTAHMAALIIGIAEVLFYNDDFFFGNSYVYFLLFETGFLHVVLAILKFALRTKLALNSEILLPLP